MIDFCTVVVLDFKLKKVYFRANSLQSLYTLRQHRVLWSLLPESHCFAKDWYYVSNTNT